MKTMAPALAAATMLLAACAPSFEFDPVAARPQAPPTVAVPDDVASFLRELGDAYGSADGAAVEKFLSADFVYQGMDRRAYLRHLADNRAYYDRLEIRPVQVAQQGEALEVVAYGMTKQQPLAPSLQILPLNVGATLVKEGGQWRLRGNQKWDEQGLYLQVTGFAGTFAPPDIDAYRRLIPAGWDMPAEPLVQLNVVEYQKMAAPQVPYRLVQLNILVSREGSHAWYYVEMPETDWLAVGAGRALGFPKFVAELAIDAGPEQSWQASLRHDGRELLAVRFAPDVAALEHLREQPRDGVIVVPGGPAVVTVTQPIGERGQLRTQPGWMTVDAAGAGHWRTLLPRGQRVPAAVYHYDKALKLVIPPLPGAPATQ